MHKIYPQVKQVQLNPAINMDTEGALKNVHTYGVSLLNRLNLEKM